MPEVGKVYRRKRRSIRNNVPDYMFDLRFVVTDIDKKYVYFYCEQTRQKYVHPVKKFGKWLELA